MASRFFYTTKPSIRFEPWLRKMPRETYTFSYDIIPIVVAGVYTIMQWVVSTQ